MLQLKDIRKEYRTGTLVQKALDGVSLALRDNEFVAVLGPSGSGKTTLLNIIGGLDRYDSGEMAIRGVPTSRYSDRDWDTYRNHTVGFIFQSYNLIPHQTILRNVELALTLTGVQRAERKRRAEEALDKVGLLEQKHKKPAQLSGGQMQRVAIARALVNDPAIVLADEPTGALDSDTGEQVMQLLREVAKDRLVVMVTHNPDLADRYATRIVRVKDGAILSDSDPYEPEAIAPPEKRRRRRERKPSMSFLTSLSLSVSNLLSKKARTILVAFAASIGIVGIAMILSLSNGANAYIRQMEADALSQYPLLLSSSSFSMEGTMMSMMQMASERETAEAADQVREQQLLGSMFSGVGTNDLGSLMDWFTSGQSGIETVTRAVEYGYGISPQIYISEKGGYRQVNPDQTWAAMGVTTDDSLTSLMSSWRTNDAFLPIPDNPDLYMDSYYLLAGTWPQKDTDCVLVLTSSGGVPDILLYTMGLKDAGELDSMISGVLAGSATDTRMGASAMYAPEDFLGISFRLLPACDRFVWDEQLGVWVDAAGNADAMKALLDGAEEMRIVGVVQPSDGSSMGLLQMGIDYPASLVKRLMAHAAESPVVQAQLAAPDVNILTGLPFGETGESMMGSLLDHMEIHPELLPEAFSFDWGGLDSLVTEDTRMTYTRAVKILRELTRTGDSPTLRAMIDSSMPLLMALIHVDEEKLMEAVSLKLDESHMQEMFAARAAAVSATCQNNLTKFGYADPHSPTTITIYPTDFDAKNMVIAILDTYNARMRAEGREAQVITYTDYVGALMSSVTTIVDVISYVLIAFVAVSLVVSSIMIGIITYISVLERRKEIGILRAMGASKRNITQVFNAETFIIGLLAGAFGIGLTLLMLIPTNRLIHSLTEQNVRAFLPHRAGLILVILCVILTFVGGFIPARKAARQDPVTALRSE